MADRAPNIVILTARDEPLPPGLDPLQNEAKLRYVHDETALKKALPSADIVLVTDFRTEALRLAWPAKHRIGWLHAASAGVDTLMFPELLNSDITLTNARGIFDRGIAEYVLGAILVFAKDTANSLHLQQHHRWRHRESERIDGRPVLVVGAGSIGGEVARLLRAVGMRVTGIARQAREDSAFDAVYGSDKLYERLPQADFVVITAPLTSATEGLFDEETFRRMKPSARLINVGRGPIVKTAALIAALQSGEIAGAALDVFEQEPLAEDSLLWDMPNVMITAHMAGDIIGWREALGRQFVDNFNRWRQQQPLLNVVDKRKLM